MQHADGHVVYEFEPACHLGAKLAGVHWWFKSRAHAAELTAGYYNTRERDGYAELMAVLKKNNCRLSFTCVEMRDCEHPPEGRCSPQGVHYYSFSSLGAAHFGFHISRLQCATVACDTDEECPMLLYHSRVLYGNFWCCLSV